MSIKASIAKFRDARRDASHKAAFGLNQDPGFQTHTDLPTLLTAQKRLPAEVRGGWKGLPGDITGSWKVKGCSESRLWQNQQIIDTKVTKEDVYDTQEDQVDESCFVGDEMSGESEMEYLIHTADIKPWSAQALIQPRLGREALVSTRTPLRALKAVDGLHKFTSKVGGARILDELTCVKALLSLVDQNCHVDFIGTVMEFMDFENSETLSVGEWARALITFFEGTQEDKEHALFNLLDQDGDHYLSNEELKEYLKPFVKAMTPEEAVVLQPCLLQHCAEKILASIKSTTCRVVAPSNVDKYGSDMVSFEELFQWLGKNSLVDSLAQIIDAKVKSIHLSIL